MQNEMKLSILNQSCCSVPRTAPKPIPSGISLRMSLLGATGAIGAWFIYRGLQPAAAWITYSLLQLKRGERLGSAVEFFCFDAPKVLMLMALAVFGIGIIRSFFTPQRTRAMLAGKRESAGNILGGLLGIVTPFCSCSAVPLFIGFVTSGIPLGVTVSFLISAPMVNEVALVLLFALFGWRIAALYAGTGLVIAIAAGWIIGRLKMERYVESWVYATHLDAATDDEKQLSWSERIRVAGASVRDIVGKVWLYVLLGIAIGAGIHGYVPENFMASFMGKNTWWSVPLAVVIGVPLYSSAAGIIPVVQALLTKGAALGTVLAFMMSVIGLSLPETIILRKVLRPQLIAVFVGVVAFGVMVVGYLFNAII